MERASVEEGKGLREVEVFQREGLKLHAVQGRWGQGRGICRSPWLGHLGRDVAWEQCPKSAPMYLEVRSP